MIRRLEEEVERLEELKKANIEKFVTNLRDELHQLWDECYFSEKQRSVPGWEGGLGIFEVPTVLLHTRTSTVTDSS